MGNAKPAPDNNRPSEYLHISRWNKKIELIGIDISKLF